MITLVTGGKPMSTPNGTHVVDEEVKDFSRPRKRILFKIDDDTFEGISDLPVMLLLDFAAKAEAVDETDDVESKKDLFRSIFEMVLTEETYDNFLLRMSDKKNPIGVSHINDIMPWLMEQYGMRPTKPSSDSSDSSGSQDGGTNLTATASPAELTLLDSPQTVS